MVQSVCRGLGPCGGNFVIGASSALAERTRIVADNVPGETGVPASRPPLTQFGITEPERNRLKIGVTDDDLITVVHSRQS